MTSKEELLAKFYRGACNREEIEQLLEQFRAEPGEDYNDVMAQLWEALTDQPGLDDRTAARMLDRTLSKIGSEPSANRKRATSIRTGRSLMDRSFQRLGVAASFLLLAAVASWFWFRSGDEVMMRTAYGEQRVITLPDRSTVKLNANSSIRYYRDWADHAPRKVWLDGEAYFEVRKDLEGEQKFQVITRDLTVEVLGTVFNINTRVESTTVFLEEGKINIDLEAQQEHILMDPGEIVTYSVRTRRPEKRKATEDTQTPASWKDGTVLMQNATLRNILAKMEEIYGVKTKVTNEVLLNRTFNFPMPVNNLDTAFLLLQESTELIVERNENELTIK